jgi:D-alanyl-D-alanine carboxypeptidase
VIVECAVIEPDGRSGCRPSAAVVPWWSVTKTLIAAAALRLAEEGRLALDEPLDGLPYSPRDLLQHRAGVGNYVGMPAYHDAVARGEDAWPEDALLARIPPERLLFAPRQGWHYSNVGYLLLRRLIERHTDVSFGAAIRTLVLEPLGLARSHLAETRADMDGTAFPGGHGYDPRWVYHGTIIGPAEEAARALHLILRGDLLSPGSRAAMRHPHPIGGVIDGRPWVSTGYGLGLMIGTMRGRGMDAPVTVLGHSAGGPGSVGAVYHAPTTGRTAAVFRAAADVGRAEDRALALLLGEPPQNPAPGWAR